MGIPEGWNVPGIYIEVEPSLVGVGPGAFPLRALVLAPGLSSGSAVVGEIYRITRVAQAADLFGIGSPAYHMLKAWLGVNPVTELDAVLTELSGGATAEGNVIFSGTVGSSFMAAFYIAGIRVEALMETSPTVCGDNLEAAINDKPEIPFTASNSAGNVTLTAKFNGAIAHSCDLRINHLPGEDWGDPNLTVAVVQPVTGTGTISITSALTAAAGTRYDVFCHPFASTTELDELQVELENRADALIGWPAMAFVGRKDTYANLATLGDGRNARFESIIGIESFPGWDIAHGAALAGMATRYLQEDPGRPVTGRSWIRSYAPSGVDLFTATERNLLLADGISTVLWRDDGAATVERLITTYQETGGGSPDETFKDIQTMFGLAYCRRSYCSRFAARFPNHKLAPDGTLARPDAHVVTPELVLDDAVAWYSGLVAEGICTNLEAFKRDSSAQISGTDPNRLEIYLAIDLINQLRVAAATIQLRR